MRETDKDGYFDSIGKDEVEGLHKEVRRLSNTLYQYILYLEERNAAKERETAQKCAEIVKKTIKDEFENTLSGQTYYVCRPDPSAEILEHFGMEE